MRLFPVRLDASPRWNPMYRRYWNRYLEATGLFVRVMLGERENPGWALIGRIFPHHVRLEPVFGGDIERWTARLQDAITAARFVQSDSASSSDSSV